MHFLEKYFEGAKVLTCYEAGFSEFWLHRHLTRKGIKNLVVHPAAVEVCSRDRVKTDKRDSSKLATQLASGAAPWHSGADRGRRTSAVVDENES